MRLLPNTHTSPETAFVVMDYPYGFRLRCQIRYWLEHHPKRGFRFVSQTTNPKRDGLIWNKPKASTYCRFGGAMYLDDAAHVQWSGLTEHCTGQEAKQWQETFGAAVPITGRVILAQWVKAKLAYDGSRHENDALTVGLVEARRAFLYE